MNLEIFLFGLGVPMYTATTALAVAGIALGAATLARARAWDALALLLGPTAGIALASCLGIYPVANRMILFLGAHLLLLLAAGVDAAVAALRGGARPLGVAAVFAAALNEASHRPTVGWVPPPSGRGREAAAAIVAAARPGDLVYVAPRAVPTWTYYTTDWTQPDRDRLEVAWRWSELLLIATPTWQPHRALREEDAVWTGTPWVEVYGGFNGTAPRWPDRSAWQVPDPEWVPRQLARLPGRATRPVFLDCDADTEMGCVAVKQGLEREGLRCVTLVPMAAYQCSAQTP